ncbi:MAG: type I phosphomannose isomerase catalytic subunit [Bacteroidota bacterium]
MANLYPLKFEPIYKQKVWGGNKIKTILQHDYAPLPNCGEVWLVSGLAQQPSMVKNGFLKDNTLPELVEIYMADLVGEANYRNFGNEFPLLFKFINAEDFLSVQVHPNNRLAIDRHNALGKTELWYVLAADQGAQLISGLLPHTEKHHYLQHLQQKTLKDILNYQSAATGDVFFVPAGLVHAIGPGTLLAEIQQSSDSTYRIYDWDRLPVDGIPRQLHTDLALYAIQFDEPTHKSHPSVLANRPVLLQDSEFFTVSLFHLTHNLTLDYCENDSFVVYLCIEGGFELISAGHSEMVSTGEAILLPADTNEIQIIPSPECKFIETYIKA